MNNPGSGAYEAGNGPAEEHGRKIAGTKGDGTREGGAKRGKERSFEGTGPFQGERFVPGVPGREAGASSGKGTGRKERSAQDRASERVRDGILTID